MLEFLLQLDYKLFHFINFDLGTNWGDVFFVWITDLHKTSYFKFIAIPLVLSIFVHKYKRVGITYFLFLFLALGVSDFAGAKVKHAFERARPFQNSQISVIQRTRAGHYSFYSNHTSNMFTFATFTSYFVPPLRIAVFTIATAVAISRVYNGVHYPSDVLAGMLAGILIGSIFTRLVEKLIAKISQRKAQE
jgi:undecaprenyl-diphosphatase